MSVKESQDLLSMLYRLRSELKFKNERLQTIEPEARAFRTIEQIFQALSGRRTGYSDADNILNALDREIKRIESEIESEIAAQYKAPNNAKKAEANVKYTEAAQEADPEYDV